MAKLSDRTSKLLAQSLPLVERNRDALVQGIEVHLRAGEEEGRDPFGQAEVSTMMLCGMLIEQVRHLLEFNGLRDIDERAEEHRALGIDGRLYSRFGDALVPVLKDVLGPTTPASVPGAWCDTFWLIVRALTDYREAA